ncbi:glycine cleavage system protein H [Coxiella-like endosymbiont of Rhipicephalus sanguineus]|uniref:glycine cleavage system protein GcvH n=1 Tax=Coxiella-like endosymbiont of Rhipicephalus sanguineus TaxID=1955402 RepID=UPI00203D23FF|nr:glycine cleavage system protein GcvH [Coxiella-like endosymbiont of Rhipicephalus sanguineus]MBT8506694.1 glycine cleavage system protein H [Coxiella-like endosymbiont of Rhipicephalus sanguineus]
MAEFPAELRYSKSHEWVRKESDGTFTVGVTDHAQEQLGDLVFIELPDIDSQVDASDEVAVVESVKTAADVYSPLTGEVVEVNEALQTDPALVNRDPYGDGWLYRIRPNDESELDELLNASDYEALTQEE